MTIDRIEHDATSEGERIRMSIKQLLKDWEKDRAEWSGAKRFSLQLPVREAARLEALAEMYGQDVNTVFADLLRVALDEVERQFPYVEGARVIAEDEFGDPVFEDAGPMPRFMQLTAKYQAQIDGTEGSE